MVGQIRIDATTIIKSLNERKSLSFEEVMEIYQKEEGAVNRADINNVLSYLKGLKYIIKIDNRFVLNRVQS